MSKNDQLRLYTGQEAAKVAGYASYSGFFHAKAKWPIPDQGFRVNGQPAWTEKHLECWRTHLVPARYKNDVESDS